MFEFQTRRQNGDIREFKTLKEAMDDAKDPSVWKVSFALPNDERCRLVRHKDGYFVYADLMTEVVQLAGQLMNG